MIEGFEFSYYISLAVLTTIIVCTFAATFMFLSSEAGGTPKVRRFSKMISEKSADTAGGGEAAGKEVVSYSRIPVWLVSWVPCR